MHFTASQGGILKSHISQIEETDETDESIIQANDI